MPPKKTFQELAQDFGLKEATIELLAKQDVDSVNVVAALKEEDLDQFNLSLGQHRLMCSWIVKLSSKPVKPPKPPAEKQEQQQQQQQQGLVTTETLGHNDQLEVEVQDYVGSAEKLNGLFRQSQPPPTRAATTSGASGRKALLIPDFVTNSRSSCEEEEKQLATDGQSTLLLKTSKAAKPKPEEVSFAQWIGANARIEAELIRRGELTQSSQLQYLKYCSHIGDLAQTSTWSSVMLFDHAFRKMQAAEDLTWDDVNNSWRLAFFHLEKRQPKPSMPRAPARAPAGPVGPRMRDNGGRQICLKYNSMAGCTYDSCKYSHCCLQPGCQARHPQHQHQDK